MAREPLDVGVVAMYGAPWELDDNFKRLEGHVREAAARGAQLVIAPEGVLDGYVCGKCEPDPNVMKQDMLKVAQAAPGGPYLVRAGKLCSELGIYLVFGFLEKAGTDLFNSSAMFDPHGRILAKHSKVNPGTELNITPGRELKPVDTPLGRIGFLICMDREVPDYFSTLGVQGAEAVIICMDGSGGPQNTRTMVQRARDNYCWIIVANTWSSVIVSPGGEIYLEDYETAAVHVQRITLRGAAEGDERWHLLHRRPDLYAPLTRVLEKRARYTADGYPSDVLQEQCARIREEGRRKAEGR